MRIARFSMLFAVCSVLTVPATATDASGTQLYCTPVPDVAFFKWPKNAPTDGLTTDDFPHYANMISALAATNLWNATRRSPRITPTDLAAFWQTNEALFQRRFFPSFMPFGAGRRSDTVLAEADFIPEGTSVSNLLKNSNLVTFDPGLSILTNAVRRDFSTNTFRFAYFNDILNRWALGGVSSYVRGGVVGFDSNILRTPLDERRAERGEHYWLVPTRYIDDPDPSGEWTKDAPLDTADWNTHLLGLGELKPGIAFRGHAPFYPCGLANVLTNLMPAWARDYCDARRIKRFDSLFYKNDVSIRGTNRTERLTNFIFTAATDVSRWDPSPRVAPSRYATANDFAALCERSIDGFNPVRWTECTNATGDAGVKFPTAQMMRYRFNELVFEADVIARASNDVAILKLTVPATSAVPYVSLDSSELSSVSLGFECYVTNRFAATNIVEHTVAGWRDINQFVSIGAGTVNVPIYNHVAGAYSFPLNDNRAPFFKDTVDRGLVYPSVWIDYTTSPWTVFLRGAWDSSAGRGYFTWTDGSDYLKIGEIPRLGATSSNLTATVSLAYYAHLLGRSPIGSARPQNFAAYPTSSSVARAKDTSSLPPIGRAWFLDPYWETHVYGFATCGVSTSLAATTDVVLNGRFGFVTNEPYKAALFTRHWKIGKSTGSTAQRQFELALDRDAQLSSCIAEASGELPLPTRAVAEDVDSGAIEKIARNALEKMCGTWQAEPQIVDDFPGKALMCIPYTLNEKTVTITKDDAARYPLFELTFTISTSLAGDDAITPRYSASGCYEVRPVLVTDWSFPSMRPQ